MLAAVGLAFGVTAFTSARSSSPHTGATQPAGSSAGPSASAAPVIPKVKVTAVGLVKGLQPWSKPLTLHVKNGTLLSVRATDNTGLTMPGTATASAWVSTGQEIPNRSYLLQAYVRGKDGTSAFHTLNVTTAPPDATIGNGVAPLTGRTVGIGFAIAVYFTAPVSDANRAAVEKGLQVTTSTPVVGAWHWFSPTQVRYRPQVYWPAHTKVTLHEVLDSVQLAPGVWGNNHADVNFTIGDAHITTVDVATQRMTVTNNGTVVSSDVDKGKPVSYDKVSTGRLSLPTLGGVHVVLEKFDVKEMKSSTLVPPIPEFLNGKKNPAYYDEKELWATRISNAGAFIHYNPLTVKVQGVAAASHGCVNTGLAQAKAFYELSLPGDIVNVVNSTQGPNVNDPGMQDWNFSWTQWLAGSATQG
ncbi:L,D-transpeptidase LdtMt2 [Acidothermaceae bacterium B102]|nr:L,D-transpeptidase LdtMt2 [Acidothermaceae bacterium B102]